MRIHKSGFVGPGASLTLLFVVICVILVVQIVKHKKV